MPLLAIGYTIIHSFLTQFYQIRWMMDSYDDGFVCRPGDISSVLRTHMYISVSPNVTSRLSNLNKGSDRVT